MEELSIWLAELRKLKSLREKAEANFDLEKQKYLDKRINDHMAAFDQVMAQVKK